MPTEQATYGPVTNQVLRLFAKSGDSQYGGEAVSQVEHALQAAYLAEKSGASASLIAAALLHDVGHLMHGLNDDAPAQGIDDQHEELAARWLSERFGPSVVEPVRLHVAAKRYLCAVEIDYLESLGPPSRLSLQLQGGPMSNSEIVEFRLNLHYEPALRLRRWDDHAKTPGLPTPTVEHFASYVELASRNRNMESDR